MRMTLLDRTQVATCFLSACFSPPARPGSIGAGVGPELIAADNYAAGTYSVYIDSYYAAGGAASCGTYTLDVTGTVPAELLEFEIR